VDRTDWRPPTRTHRPQVLPAITPEVVELVRRECEKAVAAALAAREAGEVREVAIERTPYATVTQAVATALGDVRGELLATVQPGSAVSTADAAVRKVAVRRGAWRCDGHDGAGQLQLAAADQPGVHGGQGARHAARVPQVPVPVRRGDRRVPGDGRQRKSRAKPRNPTVAASPARDAAPTSTTRIAAWRAGCRCELAEAKHERRLASARSAYRARGKAAGNPAAAVARAGHPGLAGRRAAADRPGFPDPAATTRERQTRDRGARPARQPRRHRAADHRARSRRRLGLADSTVRALRSQFRALRTTRTQRRLADVRSKAMRVARALEKETNR
jgi:hypothetical protein